MALLASIETREACLVTFAEAYATLPAASAARAEVSTAASASSAVLVPGICFFILQFEFFDLP